jgi:diguanylate cyclase
MEPMVFGFRSSAKPSSKDPPARVSDDPGLTPSWTLRSAKPEASQEIDDDRSLDTLGAVLRGLGTAAFDLEDLDTQSIRESFESMAQHVLVAAPISHLIGRGSSAKREWNAVRQFVLSHRKREVTFVQKTLGDLRSVIWNFVGIVNRSASDDNSDGLIARERLACLKAALHGNDTAALRREAAATAVTMEQALTKQTERQAKLLADFASNIQTLGEQLEGAKREAALDPLTRIPHRACFDEYLTRSAELNALLKRPASLLMIDVDEFKKVNDGFGHPAGDAVIKAVADCLVRTFPRRTDLVARYGGDEFAVILREASLKDAAALAKRLVEAVRSLRVAHAGREIRLTVSVGVAECIPGEPQESWVARADGALYRAKSEGRDRSVLAE